MGGGASGLPVRGKVQSQGGCYKSPIEVGGRVVGVRVPRGGWMDVPVIADSAGNGGESVVCVWRKHRTWRRGAGWWCVEGCGRQQQGRYMML